MGCHTWFYKPHKLKIEDARINVIETIEKEIVFNNKLIEFYNLINKTSVEGLFDDNNEHEYKYVSKEVYDKAVKIFGDGDYLELLETYPEWDFYYAKNTTKIYERQLRMIKKGLCNCAVYNKYSSNIIGVGFYSKVKKSFYFDTDDHNIFRKYVYPNVKLYSYEETIKYIEDPKNECKIYDYTYKRLKEFWDKYPDGIIDFG